jgi:pimeloyl-ACP methyl ester carboxylesterase
MGLEPVTLGGLQQWLTTEGNVNGPLLVYLHGGPGAAELAVAKRFQLPLMPHWCVVNWDQRGSGKSAVREVSLEHLVTDTCELVSLLKKRYPGRALFLMGHSWGSLLGLITLQRYPELCDGFISVGQLVAGTENEILSHQLATEKAREGFGILRRALLAERPPYGTHADALLRKCFYLYLLGGFFRRRCALSLTLTLLCSNKYTVGEKLSYMPRFRRSLKQLQPTIETFNLLTAPLKLNIPALFCIGRHDLVTPPDLAERLFEHIEVPYKRFEVFEQEAHCLHYENPEGFAQVLQDWLTAAKDNTGTLLTQTRW